jgi:hypothetical protein
MESKVEKIKLTPGKTRRGGARSGSGKPKGLPKSGGREAGTPNKATGKARLAFANFVDKNADKLQEWLDDIATNDKHGPKVAFDCLMQVAEFHVPKLARTEMVGDPNAPIVHKVYKWKD